MGVYVGQYTEHAGNEPVVSNPLTKLTLQQYHVLFDESFSTAPSSDVASSGEKMLEHFDRLFVDHMWEHPIITSTSTPIETSTQSKRIFFRTKTHR